MGPRDTAKDASTRIDRDILFALRTEVEHIKTLEKEIQTMGSALDRTNQDIDDLILQRSMLIVRDACQKEILDQAEQQEYDLDEDLRKGDRSSEAIAISAVKDIIEGYDLVGSTIDGSIVKVEQVEKRKRFELESAENAREQHLERVTKLFTSLIANLKKEEADLRDEAEKLDTTSSLADRKRREQEGSIRAQADAAKATRGEESLQSAELNTWRSRVAEGHFQVALLEEQVARLEAEKDLISAEVETLSEDIRRMKTSAPALRTEVKRLWKTLDSVTLVGSSYLTELSEATQRLNFLKEQKGRDQEESSEPYLPPLSSEESNNSDDICEH